MIIDKDAKVFGKINIIDLCILLVLVLGVVFLIYKGRLSVGVPSVGGQEMVQYEVKFYCEEVESFVPEAMTIGDNLYDDSKGMLLGKVTNLDIQPSIDFNPDALGNIVKGSKEGYNSVEVTTDLTAPAVDNGIMISGNKYGVGHSLTIRVGPSVMFVRISGIEEKGA